MRPRDSSSFAFLLLRKENLLFFACLTVACADPAYREPREKDSPLDQDGDGHPAELDCNDDDPGVHPGAIELPADGVDSDCDGRELCYLDADGDRFGTESTVPSDDLDCMGAGESRGWRDCDDFLDSVHPGAAEVCDGLDNDCDKDVDERVWYQDADADGHGNPNISFLGGCEDKEGYVTIPGDCDDARADVNSSAEEVPVDGTDQNCNGMELCYRDNDGDGYGGSVLLECESLTCDESWFSDNHDDCDDNLYTSHPGALEMIGDDVDNDCDGLPEPEPLTAYLDRDGDGFGLEVLSIPSYDDRGMLVLTAGDCDDRFPDAHPGAPERCNGRDDDCDGLIDEDPIGPFLTESCACDDGHDNDRDGLIDCEDGDCSTSSLCAEERCKDGVDDDGDGLTDCDDEDCWGPECRPKHTRARALGGRAVTRRTVRDVVDNGALSGSWGGTTWFSGEQESTMNLFFYSVWGTVQTDVNTCTWSFPYAVAQSFFKESWETWNFRFEGHALPTRRYDFRVEGGCQIPNSDWFLPHTLVHGVDGYFSWKYFWGTFFWYDMHTAFPKAGSFHYGWTSDLRWSTSRGIWSTQERHKTSIGGSTWFESILPGSVWEL